MPIYIDYNKSKLNRNLLLLGKNYKSNSLNKLEQDNFLSKVIKNKNRTTDYLKKKKIY